LTCNSALAKVSLRDPLPIELEALQEPRRVIAELPELQAEAVRAQDQERLALLYLAEANACRVIANWICQRDAGEHAVLTAGVPALVDLRIRGLIAQARGQISLGDFSRGERTLADAEVLLDQVDSPALASDVYLGYSTLSSRIGKYALSADYAMRGLDVLAPGVAVPMQIRLLRNTAEARIRLQQLPEAREALRRAEALLPDIDDPKLHAEVRLESARLAHSEGNTALQQEEGEAILQLSQRLRNTQLRGLGLEVLGLAALQAGDVPSGIEQLQDAAAAFRQLGLDRDEHRVLAGLLHQPKLGERSVALIERFIELNDQIELSERAVAADNFEDRLRYAEQELVLQQLESDRKLQVERSENLLARTNYLFTVLALSVLLLLSLIFLYFSQRRSGERLRDAVIFRQRALVQTS
ncbi:MAG: hypothetical protein KDI56_15270, partial [Xanthomonadales bacterium]|nr:hypothetical protein [Xanthomonadales bacterium]